MRSARETIRRLPDSTQVGRYFKATAVLGEGFEYEAQILFLLACFGERARIEAGVERLIQAGLLAESTGPLTACTFHTLYCSRKCMANSAEKRVKLHGLAAKALRDAAKIQSCK